MQREEMQKWTKIERLAFRKKGEALPGHFRFLALGAKTDLAKHGRIGGRTLHLAGNTFERTTEDFTRSA